MVPGLHFCAAGGSITVAVRLIDRADVLLSSGRRAPPREFLVAS